MFVNTNLTPTILTVSIYEGYWKFVIREYYTNEYVCLFKVKIQYAIFIMGFEGSIFSLLRYNQKLFRHKAISTDTSSNVSSSSNSHHWITSHPWLVVFRAKQLGTIWNNKWHWYILQRNINNITPLWTSKV